MAQSARPRAQARRLKLLAMLADGAFHSGEQLAHRLRISRGGIWKLVRSLRAIGIDVQSVPRQGYKLERAVDLLDKSEILEALPRDAKSALQQLDVLLTVDSTNRFLADSDDAEPGQVQVCVAELQNAGRGRRGRSWVAPFGTGICLSLGWQFTEAPPTFSALSLAVGVAAASAFSKLGIESVGLKWPNDLIWQNRKLGGILIEMRGESAGPAHVVIGLGINVHMPAHVRLMLAEQQAALISDVHEIMRERTPTRNLIIAKLVEEIVAMLKTFATQGFAPFVEAWQRLDTLANAHVKVISGTQTTFGTALGVEGDGTLLVDVGGSLQRFVSGEVSLRAVR